MTALPAVDDGSRLICVGRNYADHAREMGAERPARPVLFLKPGTARVPPGPVRLPSTLGRVDFEGELALLLSGDPAAPIAGVGLAVDLTLRDLQSDLKAHRLPWDTAKAFDGSALLGRFRPFAARHDRDLEELAFETCLNGRVRQHGHVRDMLFGPVTLVEAAARFWTPRPGDVMLTGTPAGVGPLTDGDVIEMRWTAGLAGDEVATWTMGGE